MVRSVMGAKHVEFAFFNASLPRLELIGELEHGFTINERDPDCSKRSNC